MHRPDDSTFSARQRRPTLSRMLPDLIKQLVDQLRAERLRDAERVRLSRAEALRAAADRPITVTRLDRPEAANDRTGTGEPMKALGAQVRPDLVDRLIELYCDWRTSCMEVQAAYERFSDASPSERAAAFAAYQAAVDREQSACESYAEQIRLIEPLCTA